MTIANWPITERPREKLLAKGPKHLSNAELIAIFLRTGSRGKTALDIARNLISEHGGIKKLLTLDVIKTPGVGSAKLATLKAAVELGRRYLEEDMQAGMLLNCSQATKQFLTSRLSDYQHEVFACLFLNNHNQMICFEELFHGTLTETNVYPREVVKKGLQHNAAKIILAHNHPSGYAHPSQADQDVTRLLTDALALVGIQVLDHMVIGGKECISFVEMGLI